MIYLFDMDGTLTEPWYGERIPDFYRNIMDMTTRSYKSNTYKYVKPLPYAKGFIDSIFDFHKEHSLKEPKIAVLTTIMNGKEYIDKVSFLSEYFTNKDGSPMFLCDTIFGVISNEEKLSVINYLTEQDNVIFFDDTVGIINHIKQNYDKSHYHCLALHSTAMLMRTVEEIADAFEVESKVENHYQRYS